VNKSMGLERGNQEPHDLHMHASVNLVLVEGLLFELKLHTDNVKAAQLISKLLVERPAKRNRTKSSLEDDL
jgi:hypothetical protein